jgi:hypothetical protein
MGADHFVHLVVPLRIQRYHGIPLLKDKLIQLIHTKLLSPLHVGHEHSLGFCNIMIASTQESSLHIHVCSGMALFHARSGASLSVEAIEPML